MGVARRKKNSPCDHKFKMIAKETEALDQLEFEVYGNRGREGDEKIGGGGSCTRLSSSSSGAVLRKGPQPACGQWVGVSILPVRIV